MFPGEQDDVLLSIFTIEQANELFSLNIYDEAHYLSYTELSRYGFSSDLIYAVAIGGGSDAIMAFLEEARRPVVDGEVSLFAIINNLMSFGFTQEDIVNALIYPNALHNLLHMFPNFDGSQDNSEDSYSSTYRSVSPSPSTSAPLESMPVDVFATHTEYLYPQTHKEMIALFNAGLRNYPALADDYLYVIRKIEEIQLDSSLNPLSQSQRYSFFTHKALLTVKKNHIEEMCSLQKEINHLTYRIEQSSSPGETDNKIVIGCWEQIERLIKKQLELIAELKNYSEALSQYTPSFSA
ncbi:MAG: hypothetical protein P4L79_04600 [Legionella sp.]|uniref:hypothetical protein n=1 Tax=Legionella sp. TaxID=459 RepID=UPI00284F5CFD|nr:hypothetical protein [Legionella sp.]